MALKGRLGRAPSRTPGSPLSGNLGSTATWSEAAPLSGGRRPALLFSHQASLSGFLTCALFLSRPLPCSPSLSFPPLSLRLPHTRCPALGSGPSCVYKPCPPSCRPFPRRSAHVRRRVSSRSPARRVRACDGRAGRAAVPAFSPGLRGFRRDAPGRMQKRNVKAFPLSVNERCQKTNSLFYVPFLHQWAQGQAVKR